MFITKKFRFHKNDLNLTINKLLSDSIQPLSNRRFTIRNLSSANRESSFFPIACFSSIPSRHSNGNMVPCLYLWVVSFLPH